MWWEYFYGRQLLRGVDLIDLFTRLDTERTFHVIDTIVADDLVENAKSQDALKEARAQINKSHGRMGGSDFRSESGSNMVPPEYVEPDENGMIPGLRDAPL